MSGEWVAWHARYGTDPALHHRLEIVRDLVRDELGSRAARPLRAISLCAGDGRDLLEVLATHPRGRTVRARLVDLEPSLVAAGRAEIERAGLSEVDFRCEDASVARAFAGAVPADLVLACGIFGNVADDDLHAFVRHLPELCARGATVVWTRGRFAPDLTPTIRRWFEEERFREITFVPIPDSTASVGAHRFEGTPRPLDPAARLFTFLPEADRPSSRAAPSDPAP
jgi:hypothetical protein